MGIEIISLSTSKYYKLVIDGTIYGTVQLDRVESYNEKFDIILSGYTYPRCFTEIELEKLEKPEEPEEPEKKRGGFYKLMENKDEAEHEEQ